MRAGAGDAGFGLDKRRVEAAAMSTLLRRLCRAGRGMRFSRRAGVVVVRAAGMKPGEKEVPPDGFGSS